MVCVWGGPLWKSEDPHQLCPQVTAEFLVVNFTPVSRCKPGILYVALFVLEMYPLFGDPLLLSAWLETVPAVMM